MTAGPYFPGAGGGGGGGGSTVVQQSVIKAYSKWLHKGSNISVREPESPWDLIPADNIYNHDYTSDPARPPESSQTQYHRVASRARVWSRNSICCPRKFIKGGLYATSKADGSAIDGVTWWPANTDRATIKADAHGGELKYPAYYHFNPNGTIGNYPTGDTHLTAREHLLADSGFTLEGGRKWMVEYESRAVIAAVDQVLISVNLVQDRRDDVAVAFNSVLYGTSGASNRDAVYDNNGVWAWTGLFNYSTHPRIYAVRTGIFTFEDDVDVYCLVRPGNVRAEPTGGLVGTTDTFEAAPGANWPMMQAVTIMEVE